MKKEFPKRTISLIISTIVICIIFSSIQHTFLDAFGLEENFIVLQTGIITTSDMDFAISNDFETKIFQNGKIMRLSGLTITGEPYYIYQKNIDNDIILKGKILVEGTFVPIIQNEIIPEPQISQASGIDLIMSTKIPHHTYARYPLIISVKVFDAELNPQAIYDQKFGALENVFVNITITNQFDKRVTSLSGNTDSTGLFIGKHIVREGIDRPGEYKVNVTIDDGTTSTNQSFKTFFRGEIRDYWQNR